MLVSQEHSQFLENCIWQVAVGWARSQGVNIFFPYDTLSGRVQPKTSKHLLLVFLLKAGRVFLGGYRCMEIHGDLLCS